MKSIPFSVFSEADLNFFDRKGEVKFRYALGKVGSNHIDQYVYCYFLTPSSKLGKTWNVLGASAGDFPKVYEKRTAIHNIEWKFSRVAPGEIDLLLVYFSGNGHLARAEFVCDFKANLLLGP